MKLQKQILAKLEALAESDHGKSHAMAANLQTAEVGAIVAESILAMEHLELLAGNELLDEPVFLDGLRRFLRIRWAYIHQSNAAYIEFPQSPINKLCQSIARAIVNKNESRFQVMMPSILEMPYICADNLKELTQEDVTVPLNLDRLIVSEDNKHVIPIDDWFNLQKGTSPHFNHLYLQQENQPVPLSDVELNLMKHSAGRASLDFFSELELREKMKTKNGTFAALLQLLIDALKDCGEKGQKNRGSERRADDKVYVSIQYFLKEAWTPSLQGRFSEHKSSSYTLGSLLLVLRAPLPGEVLTESEKEKLSDENIINCTDTIADWMNDILISNINEFSATMLSGENSEEQPKSTSLQRRCEQIESSLQERNKGLLVRYGNGSSSWVDNKWMYSQLLNESYCGEPLVAPGKIKTIASLLFHESLLQPEEFAQSITGLAPETANGLLVSSEQEENSRAANILTAHGIRYSESGPTAAPILTRYENLTTPQPVRSRCSEDKDPSPENNESEISTKKQSSKRGSARGKGKPSQDQSPPVTRSMTAKSLLVKI